MTYSEKLKDPRWARFREGVFHEYGINCAQCGPEDRQRGDKMHVHHRRYISGREPWEYELSDMMVLCQRCHKIVHDTEDRWRAFIRSMPPWACSEWDDLLTVITAKDATENGLMTIAARTRNLVRGLDIKRASIPEGYEF